MDQLDAILRLKNCYKELEEIDKDQSESEISFTKSTIAKKMLDIAKVFNVNDFIPKNKLEKPGNTES